MEQHFNQITLIGNPIGSPVYSHSNHGRNFYTFPLEVRRLSGAADRLQILIPEELLEGTEVEEGNNLCITGQIRSYNSHRPEGRRTPANLRSPDGAPLADGSHRGHQSLPPGRCGGGSLCKSPGCRHSGRTAGTAHCIDAGTGRCPHRPLAQPRW